jgi:hypothetical protein
VYYSEARVRRRKNDDADAPVGAWRSIKEGGTAIVDGGEQRILVRNVRSLGDDKFRGTILGFSPSFQHEFQGLKVGENLLFSRDEVVDVFSS